jgi:hypothetical protein
LSRPNAKSLLRNAILIVWLLSGLPICIQAQQAKAKWQRVYTGEDSVIDINVFSLRLEPNHILRVEFRTIFSKPEKLAGAPEAKYKSQLETIVFKLNEKRYRLCETTLLDPKGVTLESQTATTAEDWRVLKHGGVMETLFHAARALPPFGSWKAVDYRLADGSPDVASPAPELAELLGTRVRLHADRAEVGGRVCTSLAYENKRATKEELFRQFGIRLESLGINAEYAETINLKCEGGGWRPPQSLLVKVSEGEMLMLWDGVFLVLKRERRWTGNILPPLKRGGG